MYLGIDTSNYTTSAATFGGQCPRNVSRLLDVEQGQLGLRQSDALFLHTKRLPQIVEQLFIENNGRSIRAVAASTRPRAVEGSYMPCFLAGESLGRAVASMLHVPFHAFSHQQGHIAAALWSAGRLDLMEKPHLAWHLSGGTTELLLVVPEDKNVRATCIGGTEDVSAGQIMDRTGKLLELSFPSGKKLDELSQNSECKEKFSVKMRGLSFSLSGLENKIREFYMKDHSREDVAAYAVSSVADIILRVTKEALREYPGLEVVFSGGVASNSTLRNVCTELSPIFAEPQFSTDNALGIAILCSMQEVN